MSSNKRETKKHYCQRNPHSNIELRTRQKPSLNLLDKIESFVQNIPCTKPGAIKFKDKRKPKMSSKKRWDVPARAAKDQRAKERMWVTRELWMICHESILKASNII